MEIYQHRLMRNHLMRGKPIMPANPPEARGVHPIERCWRHITRQPDVAQAVPQGACGSLPLPGPRPHSLCGFFYLVDRAADPAIVWPVVRYEGNILSGELHDVQSSADPADLFPELGEMPLIWTPPPSPLPHLYDDFYRALHHLILLYAGRESPGADGELYLDRLEQLEPACLMPIYRALNSDFFTWAEEPREG
jgi:hypothetical protein